MEKDILQILAIQDFSRKLILANALARKIFKAEFEAAIVPYTNLLNKNLKTWNCSRPITVVRTMADVDGLSDDITPEKANSIRLLVMAAGYDFIEAAPVKSN